jgi:hypothetical protein
MERTDNPPVPSRWRIDRIEGTSAGGGVLLTDLDNDAQLSITGGRLARGPGYERAGVGSRRSLARAGAIIRLRQKNRYFLHASGVVDARGRALVFVGGSGAGKSTLAFALARHGWSLLGDDGIVLEPTGHGIVVHGWRSPLLVSLDLEEYFPEIARHRGSAMKGDARRRVPVHANSVARAQLAGLVFVAQGVPGSLGPCSESSAMLALIRQSPWVLLGDGQSAAHFTALRDIVTSVPLFDFRHGPSELERLGELFPFSTLETSTPMARV